MDELMNYRTNELPPAATQWFLYQSLVWVFGTKTVTRGGVLLAMRNATQRNALKQG